MPKPKRKVEARLVTNDLADLRRLHKEAIKRAPQIEAPPRAQAATHESSAGAQAALDLTDKAALSPEDIALFRRVVRRVTPARPNNRATLAPVPLGSAAQLAQRRQRAIGRDARPLPSVSDEFAPTALHQDDTVYLQARQGPHLIKALKRRQWPIESSLDLHGATVDQARERLDRFIDSCHEHKLRCVRIVHGKGYGSQSGDAILKESVRRWLSQLDAVQAYVECDERDGGAGALLVLLARAP